MFEPCPLAMAKDRAIAQAWLHKVVFDYHSLVGQLSHLRHERKNMLGVGDVPFMHAAKQVPNAVYAVKSGTRSTARALCCEICASLRR